MKQIIQSYKDGKIILGEVPEPACKDGGVLVRTVASVISTGTEKLMIEMGQKSLMGKARARPDLVRQALAKAKKEGFIRVFKEAMNRLDEPIPLGYSAAGVVVQVGAGVQDFSPGDRVAVAGAGFASHAEMVWVPKNLSVKIPPEVDLESAAFVMLGAIALHGVRQAQLTLGETAVVIGLGILGLLSVQMLAAQGCRVIGVDLDRQRAELAKELGAESALVPGMDDIEETVANVTGGKGADAVIISAATESNQPLLLAERVARDRARLVLVGVAEINLSRKAFWDKELIFTVSKAAGPGSLEALYEAKGIDYPASLIRWTEGRNLEAFLHLVAKGQVRLDRLITHHFSIEEALQAYDLILKNREPYIGILLKYPWPEEAAAKEDFGVRKVYLKSAPNESRITDRRALGLIGGGLFTKNILLPALNKIKGAQLVGAATNTGMTAQHLARKFGFSYATTDYREILKDQTIGSVIITTRHHLHASMVLEALAAGKHVFVEKPLCLTEEELEQITADYDASRLLMVGFNRRFAPLAQMVKTRLAGRITPLVMNYRVNAGFIPENHWVHNIEEGGGRLLGEVCHFIDFMHYMTDSEAAKVSVAAISGAMGKYRQDDNLCVTLSFQDGSIGTVLYTAKGPKTFSRERFEVFWENSVAVIEDFRRAQILQASRSQSWRKLSMDMGYLDELKFYLLEPWDDLKAFQLFSGYVASTRATIKAAEALRTGQPVLI